MTKTLTKAALIGIAVLAAGSTPAMALSLNGPTVANGWNVTPFTNWTPQAPSHPTWYLEMNDTAPVNYPRVGNLPSPGYQGNRDGEKFDLEALYWRARGSNLDVLYVGSMGLLSERSNGWHRKYRLGDLAIDVDGGGWDFSVANWEWSGMTMGQEDGLRDIHAVTEQDYIGVLPRNQGGYGNDASVAGQVNPWQARSGDIVGQAGLSMATYDYGQDEANTWFIEWSLPLSALTKNGQSVLPDDVGDLGLHLTLECGNDLLEVHGDGTPVPPDVVPEPMTMIGMTLGASAVPMYLRRRRK